MQNAMLKYTFSISWEQGYSPEKQAGMPDIREEYKKFLAGDKVVTERFNSPSFQQDWRENLRSTGRPWHSNADSKNPNVPWGGKYVQNNQNHEDVLGLIRAEQLVPGSGLEVSDLLPSC